MAAEEVLELLLLGKTGSGKSSTGNAILGRPAFLPGHNATGETWFAQAGYTRYKDHLDKVHVIRVVDSPGLYDNRVARGEGTQQVVDELSKAVLNCPNGFNALLLVLKFGARFTEEDQRVVSSLLSVFGKDFLKDFGVLVFTHGEDLDLHNEDDETDLTFEEWIGRQKGGLKNLIEECDNRCVLFRNRKKTMYPEQMGELFAIISSMAARGHHYTNEIFEKVWAEREKLIVKKNATVLRERFQKGISLIQDDIKWVTHFLDKNPRDAPHMIDMLSTLEKDCSELEEDIEREDRGSGVLEPLRKTVACLKRTVVTLSSRQRATVTSEQLKKLTETLETQRVPNVGPSDLTAVLRTFSRFMLGHARLKTDD